jgi:hypothetical protein
MTQNASDTVNSEAKPKADRIRIPMSVPVRMLETPEIPGYHTHWIKEENIPRAHQAWYEFVQWDDVPVNQRNVGTDKSISGNTDMGSHVSVVDRGGTGRLYLMKLKEELWLEDRRKIDERNASLLGGIFRGEVIMDSGPAGETKGARDHRYVDPDRTSQKPALFNRRRVKS